MTSPADSPIRLIVGLGNPGDKYQATRHNAGFWLVERLARDHNIGFRPESRFFGETCRIRAAGHDCWLLKPSTFMNRSGQSVSSLAHYYRIAASEILVAHDELDLSVGSVRLKRGGGHAGHNGLRDIISALGMPDFWRLRIGIDRPSQGDQAVNYVLGRPSREEAKAIDQALAAVDPVLGQILNGQFQLAMNRLHTAP